MHTKKTYSIKQMIWWTRFETLFFIVLITILVSVYYFFELHWIKIPWTPLALIGTAVAFVIGFQNNAAYGRIWEARKIWGGIVNASRTLGTYTQDMVTNEHTQTSVPDEQLKHEIKTITYRHIAWMTALRHSMRTSKPWETEVNHKTNQDWDYRPPEFDSTLEEDLKPYISEKDFDYTMSKSNKQTALLYLQSHHIRKLKDQGIIWEFSFLEIEAIIKELFTLQGQSERIKNFPYPRQFATLNHYFVWVFVLLLPLALIPQFAEIGTEIVKTNPLIRQIICLVFNSLLCYCGMDLLYNGNVIGRTGENPFEGTANDVPISTISRGI